MMPVFALLRCLGRPLAALAALLVVVGTVLPVSPAGAGPFCLPDGVDGLPGTHCDACLPLAIAPDASVLPPAAAMPRQLEAAEPALPVRALRRGRVWIRGPPPV